MNLNSSQINNLVSENFEKIKNKLTESLKTQFNGVIKTGQGDYEIVKIEKTVLEEIHIEGDKFHDLFAPNGFKVSGTILLKAQAYKPNSDKNSYTSHTFVIAFKPTSMKFDFKDETFSMQENIVISYINKASVERNI